MVTNHLEPKPSGSSPFDTIKNTRPDGTEYWSARDLMPMLGYDRWQNFAAALDRAKVAAEAQGLTIGEHFVSVVLPTKGRPRGDCHVSKMALKLIIGSAHPGKREMRALRLGVPASRLPDTKEDESQVYFIAAPAVQMVKIGISINPQRRMGVLQVGSPTPLDLLAKEHGGAAREKELHETFAKYRSHGEWFRMVPEIENYISRLSVGKELAHV